MDVNFEWSRFDIIEHGGDEWEEPSPTGRFVLADDAIKREAELLERIRELEERAEKSRALIEKAIGLIGPGEGA